MRPSSLRIQRPYSYLCAAILSPQGLETLIAVSTEPETKELDTPPKTPTRRDSEPKVDSDSESEMGETEALHGDHLQQFVQSTRSGRRNAMPDLGVDDVDIGAHKLAEQFSQLEASSSKTGSSNFQDSSKSQVLKIVV